MPKSVYHQNRIIDRRNTRGVWDAIDRYSNARDAVMRGDPVDGIMDAAEGSVDVELDKLVRRILKREAEKVKKSQLAGAAKYANRLLHR